jgi:hypothetical protein
MVRVPKPGEDARLAKVELIAGRLGAARLIELDELRERLSAFQGVARSLGVEMYWSVVLEPTRGDSDAH